METKTSIKGDFGSAQTIDIKIARLAAQCVALNANDTEEALLLLDMLGLIDPLPQNEVVILKKDRLTPERKEARAKSRLMKKEADQKRIRELDIQPHEIGE